MGRDKREHVFYGNMCWNVKNMFFLFTKVKGFIAYKIQNIPIFLDCPPHENYQMPVLRLYKHFKRAMIVKYIRLMVYSVHSSINSLSFVV